MPIPSSMPHSRFEVNSTANQRSRAIITVA
eukprot:UN12020